MSRIHHPAVPKRSRRRCVVGNSGLWCLLGVALLVLSSGTTTALSLVPTLVKKSLQRTATGAAIVGGARAVVALAANRRRRRNSIYRPPVDSLQGQTILITGGTTGLGLETAKRLAIGGPSQIIVTARTDTKGEAAVQAVKDYLTEKKVLNDCQIGYKILDLDSLQGIRDAVAEKWGAIGGGNGIDVLINNAGVMALPQRELTVDFVERQMQSNHLGHFLLTALLAPRLKKNARIINVSSEAHKFAGTAGMDFDYCWEGEPKYGAWRSYGQSKLANILFTQELQRRVDAVDGLDWEVACLHPGVVGTDLGRNLMGVENWERLNENSDRSLRKVLMAGMTVFLKTPEQGATTHVWLASKRDEIPRGRYYSDCKPQTLAENPTKPEAAARLWKESEELIGMTFDVSEFAASPQEVTAVEPEVVE